jgi:serine/threonine-protein kinase
MPQRSRWRSTPHTGAGIVHRDLKPGNVMLTKSGTKLLDFGLAKLAAEDKGIGGFADATRTSPAPLTSQGALLGTLHYMSPEQLEGGEVDTRSDIHAFGALLLRNAGGPARVRGPESGRDHRGHHRQRAAAAAAARRHTNHAAGGCASRARSPAHEVSRQGSGRPLAIRSGSCG